MTAPRQNVASYLFQFEHTYTVKLLVNGFLCLVPLGSYADKAPCKVTYEGRSSPGRPDKRPRTRAATVRRCSSAALVLGHGKSTSRQLPANTRASGFSCREMDAKARDQWPEPLLVLLPSLLPSHAVARATVNPARNERESAYNSRLDHGTHFHCPVDMTVAGG